MTRKLKDLRRPYNKDNASPNSEKKVRPNNKKVHFEKGKISSHTPNMRIKKVDFIPPICPPRPKKKQHVNKSKKLIFCKSLTFSQKITYDYVF